MAARINESDEFEMTISSFLHSKFLRTDVRNMLALGKYLEMNELSCPFSLLSCWPHNGRTTCAINKFCHLRFFITRLGRNPSILYATTFPGLRLVFPRHLDPRGRRPAIIKRDNVPPASTNLLEQWVELYNREPTRSTFTGWKFGNGNSVLISLQHGWWHRVVTSSWPPMDRRLPASFLAWLTLSRVGRGPIEGTPSSWTIISGKTQFGNVLHDGDWAVRVLGAVQFNTGLGMVRFARRLRLFARVD